MQIRVNGIDHLSDNHEVLMRGIKILFFNKLSNEMKLCSHNTVSKIFCIMHIVDSVWFMWCFGGAYPPPMENAFTYTFT